MFPLFIVDYAYIGQSSGFIIIRSIRINDFLELPDGIIVIPFVIAFLSPEKMHIFGYTVWKHPSVRSHNNLFIISRRYKGLRPVEIPRNCDNPHNSKKRQAGCNKYRDLLIRQCTNNRTIFTIRFNADNPVPSKIV